MDKMQQAIVYKWLDSQTIIEKYEYINREREFLVFFKPEITLRLERKLAFKLDWFIIDNFRHFLQIQQHWNEKGIFSDLSWYDDLAMGW